MPNLLVEFLEPQGYSSRHVLFIKHVMESCWPNLEDVVDIFGEWAGFLRTNVALHSGDFVMAIALWVVQGLIAAVFLMAGAMKVVRDKDALTARLPWAEKWPAWSIKVIGGLEVAGALGLILPMVTGIAVWLTPIAAIGLVLTMIGAMVVHVRRNETQSVVGNVVLLLLALFVAYGRYLLVPVVG